MRYLITTTDGNPPFYTWNFIPENHFNSDAGMIAYDLENTTYTKDGKKWELIEFDHL